jgi:hypothetical protein
LIQINQIATDIAKYKVIHTGAKTQSGGLNVGFIIVEYQGSLERLVTRPPHADAAKAKTININKEIIFLDKDINIIFRSYFANPDIFFIIIWKHAAIYNL